MATLKRKAALNPPTRKEAVNPAAGKKSPKEDQQYREVRQCFFQNLLILGFDKEANEKKDNVAYNEDTFVVANNKGALTVLHFLLNKLDPDEFKTRFRGIWPVFDKKQEQSFRKEICGWLNKIALEDPEASFSRLNPSLFLSPGGYRFQIFLFQFSRYVVMKCLQRDCGVSKDSYLKCPVLKNTPPHLVDVQVMILKKSTIHHMQSFVDNVEQSMHVHSKWHEQVGEMVKDYRVSCKKVRALERKEKQHEEEKAISAEKWAGDDQVKEEGLKNVREDWQNLRNILQSENEECEIISSILKNTLSQHKIDLNTINASIPDLLLRVQEHQIQEQQIDNLYKEGKLNLVSLVKLLNLSLGMYLDKLKSAGLPNTKENIAPLNQKLETHSKILKNMQTQRENMKERLHSLKDSVRASAAKADKKIAGQKLLPMEFTLNAPTPPRNFQLLCDRSVPVDSPLAERHLSDESIDTPEAARKIQMAAKENALKDEKSGITKDQLSLVPEMLDEKKSKLPLKVTQAMSGKKEFGDSTPQIKNSKPLNKGSFNMQIRTLGEKVNPKGKAGVRSKSMSECSEKKAVDIWADQVIDHVMGVSDVDPQNINEALSMDAFISRDKLARSPVKSCSSIRIQKFSPSQEDIPEIEIDAGTPSPCHKKVHLKSASISSLTDLYSSPMVSSNSEDYGLNLSPAFDDRRQSIQSEMSILNVVDTPSPYQESPARLTELHTSPLVASGFTEGNNRLSVSPALADRRQSNQSEKGLDASLDSYLQFPANHKGLNLDIFDDVPQPKMRFVGLNSGGDASDRMAPTDSPYPIPLTIDDIMKDRSSNNNSEQPDINCSDYFTPLKHGLNLKRTSKLDSEEKSTSSNQSGLLDSATSTSIAAYNNSLRETEDLIFEDEDPVFLVPGDDA